MCTYLYTSIMACHGTCTSLLLALHSKQLLVPELELLCDSAAWLLPSSIRGKHIMLGTWQSASCGLLLQMVGSGILCHGVLQLLGYQLLIWGRGKHPLRNLMAMCFLWVAVDRWSGQWDQYSALCIGHSSIPRKILPINR